jgi:hypothetical protein
MEIHFARKIISQNVYEKLHNKFTSTYPRRAAAMECFRKETSTKNSNGSSSARRDSGATAAHLSSHEHAKSRQRDEEQINVCCANKSFLNFSTRNFHYIDCFSALFSPLLTALRLSSPFQFDVFQCSAPIAFPPRHSRAEVKKMHIDDFNLCKTHYSVVYDRNFSQFIKQVAPLKNQFEYQHRNAQVFVVVVSPRI